MVKAMIETMSDILSLGVMIIFVFAGFVAMLSLNSRPASEKKRRHNVTYDDFYESADDEYDDERNVLYYE